MVRMRGPSPSEKAPGYQLEFGFTTLKVKILFLKIKIYFLRKKKIDFIFISNYLFKMFIKKIKMDHRFLAFKELLKKTKI